MAHYDEQRELMEVIKAGNQVNAWYDYEQCKTTSLPPIGCECEYTLSGNSWFKCSIVSQNKLVISCPHIAEMDDNGNGLQVIHPESVQFRPLDWCRAGLTAEFSFHLANAFNELKAAIGLLDASLFSHDLLAHALQLIKEVKGEQQ